MAGTSSIDVTVAHTGRAEYSTYAKAEYGEFTTINAWVNKQPNGQPYLLSWVYRLAGASEDVSFTAERVAVGITAALFFLALVLLPVPLPAGTALAVPLCYLFTPLVLWWGHTVAVEPTAVLTTIAAIFAASLHARARHPETGEGSLATGTLLAATAAFAAYFRPESLLVFPVVASADDVAHAQHPLQSTWLGDLKTSGRPRVGSTVRVQPKIPASSDYLGLTVTYQWSRVNAHGIPTEIPGATGARYTVTRADRGKSLWVDLTYTPTNPDYAPYSQGYYVGDVRR